MDDSFGFNSLNQTVIDMEEGRELNTIPNLPISIKVELTKFHGFTSENAVKFLHEFESFCVLQNLSDNPRKIAAFHLHLKGPALVWFNALDLTDKLAWTVLKDAFQKQYLSRNMSNPAFIAESAIFDSLTLQNGMAIETFHSQILEKGSRLEKPERDLTAKFINGLPDQLAFFVRAANPVNLQSAFQQAKLGEAYGYHQSLNPISVAAIQPASSMASTLNKLIERLDRLERKESNEKSDRRRPSTDRRENKAPITRFTCNGPKHRKFECNWNQKGKS